MVTIRGGALVLAAALIGIFVSSTATATTCTVPAGSSVVNVDQDCGCNSADISDDTACWQAAIAAATSTWGDYRMGTIVANGKGVYIISDTLVLSELKGGAIDGHGAKFYWVGADDRPMWKLDDTNSLTIKNMYIQSDIPIGDIDHGGWAAAPLDSGFELTNGNGNIVTASGNIIENVTMEGTAVDGLNYGVKFTIGGGGDNDNDQAIIRDCVFNTVTEAAIWINGQNCLQHRIYNTSAYGAPGASASRFIQLDWGSFMLFGGVQSYMTDAVFVIGQHIDLITISQSYSEASNRFIRTWPGWSSPAEPLTVIGSTFAVESLNSDGQVIKFERQGPLNLFGFQIKGTPPALTTPVIRFDPPFGESPLTVSGANFRVDSPATNSYDVLSVGTNARSIVSGNVCANSSGQGVPCTGVAAGTLLTSGSSIIKPSELNATNSSTANYCPVKASSDQFTWSEVVTPTGTQTLTNKTLSSTNTFPETSAFIFSSLASSTAQRWFGPNTGAYSVVNADAVSVPTPAFTARSLWCKLGSAPGASNTWTLTALTGAAPGSTLLSCTVSGASSKTCNTTGSAAMSAGSNLSLRITATAGTPLQASVFCSLGVSP